MAAFLSNEERDAIRFETGELSRWFGLRSRTALFVEHAGEAPSWPRFTFEWAIPAFLEEIQYQEGPDGYSSPPSSTRSSTGVGRTPGST
ncbi:hypothetical protein [Halalkalicoccus ordinarius]|uniref:hypothetical protein n=1 Tax=Halalkalicoccus ordinarius TaxID=3116651 RepID=UPI00300F223F